MTEDIEADVRQYFHEYPEGSIGVAANKLSLTVHEVSEVVALMEKEKLEKRKKLEKEKKAERAEKKAQKQAPKASKTAKSSWLR